MVARQRGALGTALTAALSLCAAIAGCTGSVDSRCGTCDPGTGVNAQRPSDPNTVTPATDEEPGGIGDARTTTGVGNATRIPKISNAQWESSTQDLLRLAAPSGLSEDFTPEAHDKGYDTVAASTLTVSGDAWSRYQTAAEALALQVTSDAAQLAKITPSGTFANDNAKADAFVTQFGRRAFRRALSNDEKAAYLALYAQGPALAGGAAFPAGVRLVLEAMLQSPNFLYRVETSTNDKNPKDPRAFLSGYELATRLSFALTGSTPSDELLTAAENKELDSADGVAKWAAKLLDTPRAKDMLLSFNEQTFGVSDFGTQDKDPALKFNAAMLEPTLKDEARSFLSFVIDQGGGIELLLTSNVAFVNASTAPFYGLSGISGTAMQQRELDAKTRAGLLTQVGFLSKNATRNTSDPVHRGLGVLRRVLCDEPDPPPMMFSLPQAMAGLTTREVYEKATACGVGCHDTLINPPGFSFEMFDAVGSLRTSDQGKPIDATGTLTLREGYTSAEKRDGKQTKVTFDGAVDLMNQLADQPRVHECYARNFMRYVLGRELAAVERGAGSALGEASQKAGSMRELLLSLVKLDTFRARVSDPE
jgi:Protein of unknown function (DUF1592)/Protein of unknown function (DUF1588)/Protein of unknown function (DUF1595)/Protein of unknown function (DUF1585)/Protein of unknown function (DUF1587)